MFIACRIRIRFVILLNILVLIRSKKWTGSATLPLCRGMDPQFGCTAAYCCSGEVVTGEELGGARVHSSVSGITDHYNP